MQATIIPGRCTQTTVAIPPSKSMAHRAIICAALAQGESLIHHVDYSDDILTTIDGMRKLGAHIELEGSDVRVQGIPDFNQLQSEEISGSCRALTAGNPAPRCAFLSRFSR